MDEGQLSAFLAPLFTVLFLAGVGLIARLILWRIPEGRLKRVLTWPPDPSGKAILLRPRSSRRA